MESPILQLDTIIICQKLITEMDIVGIPSSVCSRMTIYTITAFSASCSHHQYMVVTRLTTIWQFPNMVFQTNGNSSNDNGFIYLVYSKNFLHGTGNTMSILGHEALANWNAPGFPKMHHSRIIKASGRSSETQGDKRYPQFEKLMDHGWLVTVIDATGLYLHISGYIPVGNQNMATETPPFIDDDPD